MRRELGYHLLFGTSLLALMALGSWWTVYINRSVELEYDARRQKLASAAELAALRVGGMAQAPAPGPVPWAPDLEIVPAAALPAEAAGHVALPRRPDLRVRIQPQALAELRHKAHRRRLMAVGEGSLLFVLLGVCTVMLYRLVNRERVHARRMQDFVHAVSHEMKTPLAGIKSMLQTFEAGRVPEDQRPRLLALGLREAERLQHTIENVLISGSLRTERYQLELQPLPLHDTLERFVTLRRRFVPDRPEALSLLWELPQPEAAVQADAAALRVILDNLTDNAFKYGGDEPRVRLRVGAGPRGLTLSVEDEGMGFEPHHAEALFEPFRRGDQAASRALAGTGLGLSIARSLARRMGGDLRASSPGPGQGSRFDLSLREAGA